MGCGWSQSDGKYKVSDPRTMVGNIKIKNGADKVSNNPSKVWTKGN